MSTIRGNNPELDNKAAVFVTLTKNGRLRGCIGTVVAQQPLIDAVMDMAVGAACNDPRFPRVTPEELKITKIEISVLSPMEKIASHEDILPGVHGVVVRKGARSGLFLPQVWESLPQKNDFLSELCSQKAGIPPDAWKDPSTELYIFTVFKFEEQ